MSRKETTLFSGLLLGAVTLAFAGGYLARDIIGKRAAPFPLLIRAHEILEANAFDPLPGGRELEHGMIRGMVSAYGDPFTTFNAPVQHELQTDSLEGSYGGIGARFDRGADGALRLYPFPDGPAAAAGVADGDILVAVDGSPIPPEMAVDDVIAAERGLEGTVVLIEVLRDSTGEELAFSIERAQVPLPSVFWYISPEDSRLGLIEVNIFAESTDEEIRSAANDLSAQGAEYFALDLRDNGGGLLQAGIDCARLFLTQGVVIELQYRDKALETHRVERPGELTDLPLVVWINHGTASASEICAGALQANGRTPLIGAPSFGKNAIQLVFELDDGSSLSVTSAKWWIPGLEFPAGESGLLPDIEVAAYEEYLPVSSDHFAQP